MKTRIKTLVATFAIIAAPFAAAAQDVRLMSNETGFSLSGTLLEFDGETYTISTSIGQLSILASEVACEGDCPATAAAAGLIEDFGVIGSSTIGETLMPGLIEAYSFALGGEVVREVGAASGKVFKLHDDAGAEVASISVDATSSSSAFPGLLTGDAAIGMASRPIRENEVAALESAGVGRIDRAGTEHILALDGVVVVVSPRNPISTLNVLDIAAVFTGEIDNWAALGGPDAEIRVLARAPGSGTYDTFDAGVLAPGGGELTPNAKYYDSDRQLADAVANDPFAIGFTGLAFQRNAKALSIEGTCGLIFEPNEFNVKTEEYPLSRRLFLYTTGEPIPAPARGLLEFALSDDAQVEIAGIGFVDQSITSISLNEQGRRIAEAFVQPRDPEQVRMMRDMALELLDAERLSTTLRFQPQSSVLDVKSEADLTRFARFIAAGGLENKQIVLIGFADDVDRFEAAVGLSTQRASQIRATLEAELTRAGSQDEVDIVSMGFGSLAPVTCSDDPYSTTTNRRVEVWIRDRF